MHINLLKRAIAFTSELSTERSYWIDRFDGGFNFSSFPPDLPGSPVDEMAPIRCDLPETLSRNILRISKGEYHRVFVILAAGLVLLLDRVNPTDPVIFGIPVPRSEKDPDNFLNKLVLLKHVLDRSMACKDLIYALHSTIREAYIHQDYPVDVLLDDLSERESVADLPLVDICLALDNLHDTAWLLQVRTNIFFSFCVEGDKISGKVSYNSSRYLSETMMAYIGYYLGLLDDVLAQPEMPAGLLKMVSGSSWISTSGKRVSTPPGESLIGQFEDACKVFGDRTAVAFNREEYSYSELNKCANQLSRYLTSRGAVSRSIVGILLQPGYDMIISILAVLKCGCAFLPMEADNRIARTKHILADSGCKLIIKRGYMPEDLYFDGVVIDLDKADYLTENKDNPSRFVSEEDLAMVIYTSGTRGQPKGAMILNKGLCNYVTWFMEFTSLTSEDRFALTVSIACDFAYTLIFGALLNGITLHVLPKEVYTSPAILLRYFGECGITFMKLTPSYLSMLVREPEFNRDLLKAFKLVMLVGDPIDPGVIREANLRCPGIRVINHFSATETTIGSIAGYIDSSVADTRGRVAVIGKPIFNMRAFILSPSLEPMPVCIPGELYMAGKGVAAGYLNRPELTTERFLPNPFCETGVDNCGSREDKWLYKTGDMARMLPDGNIQFLGRNDDRVRIRGFRVEINEVEAAILREPYIISVAVIFRPDPVTGEKFLYAYVVPTDPILVAGLKSSLRGVLPEYMVPAFVVVLDKLELSGNGKLDRTALPDPRKSLQPDGTTTRNTATEDVAEQIQIEEITFTISQLPMPGMSIAEEEAAAPRHGKNGTRQFQI